jgi:colanic acid/amylovoran biosynthesis glycosyltransferase
MDILLITNTFPFGKGETFISNEIPFLSAAFDTVYILPLKGNAATDYTQARPLPENCKVLIPQNRSIIDIRKPSWRNIPALIGLLCKAGFAELRTWKTALLFLSPRNFIVTGMRLNRALEYEKEFARIIGTVNTGNTLVYSYWVDSWLVGLFRLREKRKLNFLVVARAHRGDLYHEAGTIGYQTHRKYLWKRLDYLYPISKMGYDYLLNLYPELRSRMKTFYLGVKDYHQLSPYVKRNAYTVVSCSNLIPVKRVHLIIEMLHLIAPHLNVNWVHIGGGQLAEELQRQAKQLSPNIVCTFKGHMDPQNIMKFYLETQIDLFLNVSESEGIPVSIMEVISVGIPVMVTDAGGTREVMHSDFGYLLPKDFKPAEAAAILERHFSRSEEEIKSMRRRAYEYFRENFCDEKNYQEFIREIKAVHSSR